MIYSDIEINVIYDYICIYFTHIFRGALLHSFVKGQFNRILCNS